MMWYNKSFFFRHFSESDRGGAGVGDGEASERKRASETERHRTSRGLLNTLTEYLSKQIRKNERVHETQSFCKTYQINAKRTM